MPAPLILVDEHDKPRGIAAWEAAHASPGTLHRAFSAYVFRKHGAELLMQRRSGKKPLFAGLWANTCCSHPREGEELLSIAPRRLQEEFGFTSPLTSVSTFVYQAEDPSGNGAEHEHVTILRGDVQDDVTVRPNPDEVGEWKWIAVTELQKDMANSPENYAPWFPIGLEKLLKNAASVMVSPSAQLRMNSDEP